MRAFTQKQKRSQQNKSSDATSPSQSFSGQSFDGGSILPLQRTSGKQEVQRLLEGNGEEREDSLFSRLSPRLIHEFSKIPVRENVHTNIQTKLRVNVPGDKYEQEADRVAEQVMRMPESQLLGVCPCGGGCPKGHALEFSLQTMSEPLLAQLKTVRMVRQKVKQDKKGRKIVPDTKHCGLTLTWGADKTIIIFDCGVKRNDFLFVGGAQGVRQRGTLLITHELGHVIEGNNRIRAKFNAFVKAKKIKPPTAYAASNKTKEFFPEAIALFQNDPRWMQANLPDLFQWFEMLSQTGKAP
jgi:hypothetical protein